MLFTIAVICTSLGLILLGYFMGAILTRSRADAGAREIIQEYEEVSSPAQFRPGPVYCIGDRIFQKREG